MTDPRDLLPQPPWYGPPLPGGKLHSSRPHIEDVKDVARGAKPIALVNKEAMEVGRELGLKAIKVPEGTFKLLKDRLTWIVYPKGSEDRATRVLEVFKKYPLSAGPRPPQYHIELGRALGYSEADISLFLKTFFGV